MIWPFKPGKVDAPAPSTDGGVVWAIGDIHGRADLLDPILSHIEQEARGSAEPPRVIFLGDYVDRGPAAFQVVEHVLAFCAGRGVRALALKGNHEELLLDFLDKEDAAPRWLELGGLQTLASYGVAAPSGPIDPQGLSRLRQAFRSALPPRHERFFRSLTLWSQDGDYVFVHAGIDPAAPMDAQTPYDLLWRRPSAKDDRRLSVALVHGHTPSSELTITPRRLGLDTGAFATGRLTAARLQARTQTFYTTEPTEQGIRLKRYDPPVPSTA